MEDKKIVRILYAEDDREFASLFVDYLREEGEEVVFVENGAEAWQAYDRARFDVVLLDVDMPGRSGLELVDAIRKQDSETLIVMFSSMDDRIEEALDRGADDFIRKDYDVEEIESRLRAIIRRMRGCHVFRISHDTTFEYLCQLLTVCGREIKLKPIEAKLLRMLCEKAEEVVDKERLCERLWGVHNAGKERSLDAYLVTLRKHLQEDAEVEIKTLYNEGVCLRCSVLQ